MEEAAAAAAEEKGERLPVRWLRRREPVTKTKAAGHQQQWPRYGKVNGGAIEQLHSGSRGCWARHWSIGSTWRTGEHFLLQLGKCWCVVGGVVLSQ